MAKAKKQTNSKTRSVQDVTEFGPVRIKVSEKGAISVYDIRRFPITFYIDEWEWLFAKADAIRDFAARNADELKEVEAKKKAISGTETI